MARWAFLLGRNTGSLRHCWAQDHQGRLARCDVQLMREALVAHGFECEIPPRQSSRGEITDRLDTIIERCKQDDTFVFYFAGHSWGEDGLRLAIGDPFTRVSNLLPADHVVDAVRHCAARSKLVILDSCEAGQAAGAGLFPDPAEHFRVLTATDGAHVAVEREALEAGVFTYHLWRALMEPPLRTTDGSGVLDENGHFGIEQVYRWLKRTVPAYRQEGELPIPEPRLYGGAGMQVFFATDIDPYRYSGFAPIDIARLRPLINQVQLKQDELGQLFADVAAASDLAGSNYAQPPPDVRQAGIDAAIDYLVDVGRRLRARVKVPLLEFVARLAPRAANPDDLLAWNRQVAQTLKDEDFSQRDVEALIAGLGQTGRADWEQPAVPTFLQIALTSDANRVRYRVQVWLVDARGDGDTIADVDAAIAIERLPELMASVLDHPNVKDALARTDRFTLELFLDEDLLRTVDVDDWTPGIEDGEMPLSYHYEVVLRPRDRYPPFNRWKQGWPSRWNGCQACRDSQPADRCARWIRDPASTNFGKLLFKGRCLFILETPPTGPDDLVTPLTQGVAMLLWRDGGWSDEDQERLHEHLAGFRLGELPRALQALRVELWEPRAKECLRLIWDVPQRTPLSWRRDVGNSGQVIKLSSPL
ncbi:MAG: caspase family protein [Pseudomonadota bacterium]|nr:caspase family protein [Pseudomonadota bacterium]